MRIIYGIILALTFSCCSSQNDYDDNNEIDIIITNSKECTHKSGESAVCVKESQCDTPRPTVDPATLFTIRNKNSNTGAPDAINQCDFPRICCLQTMVVSPTHIAKNKKTECGYSNPGAFSVRALQRATNAVYADFPWMVALMLKKNTPDNILENKTFGGGTLIHPNVVMTAAHKATQNQANEITCRAGEWDLSKQSELYKYQDRDVMEIIIHDDYDNVYLRYDIAVLILSSPFNLIDSPHIGVACLEPNLPTPGTVCYSMGWGQDFRANNKSATILKKLTLPLVGKNDCERSLRQTILGDGYTLHNTLTCAGGERGVDTCVGDGGSSLVCHIKNNDQERYSVVGMVAYGVDCWNNLPGVYVKIPELYEWVTNQMISRNFDVNVFKYTN